MKTYHETIRQAEATSNTTGKNASGKNAQTTSAGVGPQEPPATAAGTLYLKNLRKTTVRVFPNQGSTELPQPSRWDAELMLAWDSEWDRYDTKENTILSYQIAALEGGVLCSRILYPAAGERLTLDDIIRESMAMSQEAGLLHGDTPTNVYLFGHWTTADMRALADFTDLKTEFDGLRGSLVTLKKPHAVHWTHSDGREVGTLVHLRDTKLLAPNGKQSLEALGDIIQMPKIELPEGAKEHMGKLMVENPDLFEQYAERDPIITVRYARQVAEMLSEFIGPHGPFPVTLGGLAEKACKIILKSNNIDEHELFGNDVHKETKKRGGKWQTKTRIVRKEKVDLNYTFGCESYHGGRNETYQFGASDMDQWYDYDLVSAYPTALATLGMPDWKNLRHTTEVVDFTHDTLGVALVEFQFPESVRQPTLPVRSEKGLIFPRTGRTFCTAAELDLARKLGASIQLEDGVIIPMKEGRPFELIFQHLSRKRNEYPKGSLGNLLYKELSNSLYGKMAQGLRKKRVFDTREAERHDIPPSSITNPFLAAYTTGCVRAALGELMNSLPSGRQVISATTDGFITNATPEDLQAAASGPICQLCFTSCNILNGGKLTSPVEVKRTARQLLAWRRRGQATLAPSGSKLILAKAGLKSPTRDETEQNRWIIEQFKTRNYATHFTYNHLPSLYELYTHEDVDLVSYEKERRLNMDYDFCRKPVALETREIEGVPHVFFKTEPWKKAEEGVRAGKEWASFSATRRVAMREEAVLREFLERLSIETRPTRKRGTPLKLAIRTFLQAYLGNLWGLKADLSYNRNRVLAEWLQSYGYEVSVRDVENAKRDAKPEEHWIPKTAESLQFAARVKARWPDFQEHLLFVQEPEGQLKCQIEVDAKTSISSSNFGGLPTRASAKTASMSSASKHTVLSSFV